MALMNYAAKEITLKVVYYGPGLSGKTTNLQHLHSSLAPERRGKLISLATETDRTLFFDFMPVTLGKISDFSVRFQLYTVPGQVRYNATRKLVLKGADAVVFVADSQRAMKQQNIESFRNMRDNLVANNLDPDDIPVVVQYNKRDLKSIMPVEELDNDINRAGHPSVEAEAITGGGVRETFDLITKTLIRHIAVRHKVALAPTATPPVQPTPEPPGARPAEMPVGEPVSIEAPAVEETVSYPAPAAEPKESMPSLELESAATELPGTAYDLYSAVQEISQHLKDSSLEMLLRELVYSTESLQSTTRELLEELRASRKNQEEIIKALKKSR